MKRDLGKGCGIAKIAISVDTELRKEKATFLSVTL